MDGSVAVLVGIDAIRLGPHSEPQYDYGLSQVFLDPLCISQRHSLQFLCYHWPHFSFDSPDPFLYSSVVPSLFGCFLLGLAI